MNTDDKKMHGLLAISPLILFLLFLVVGGLIAGDFSKIPIVTSFLFASIYAVAITPKLTLPDRVRVFGRGAGTTKMMFMIWIFIIAGAFSYSASAMGCIQETVNIILGLLPPRLIFISIFLAGCFISMATGSGMGTIVALGPVAVGVANATSTSMPLLCAIVVCGAMFGDNLSFISDTTVIATSTQGCEMKDKFRTNIWIAIPAAVLALVLYYILGQEVSYTFEPVAVNYWKVIPYIAVIVMAICGVDVLITLVSGTAICGIMGMIMGDFDFFGWMNAMAEGINGMGSIIIIVILAAGLMALIKHNGGMDFIVRNCTRFVKGKKSAEACISILTGLVCICTSNNTIAIVSVADVVKDISQRYGVAPRKAASLMDTSSCIALEVIPYSSHLLCMAGIAGIAASTMLPFVYYAFLLAVMVTLSIVFNFPKTGADRIENLSN